MSRELEERLDAIGWSNQTDQFGPSAFAWMQRATLEIESLGAEIEILRRELRQHVHLVPVRESSDV